jgi:twitching motility protein PilT
MPRADRQGRVAALEILFLDDAIRNLIRQGKIEQVYSYMQTGTRRGMQTMEQSLLELVQRSLITVPEALGRSSRPEALVSALERAGISIPATSTDGAAAGSLVGGLRVAES